MKATGALKCFLVESQFGGKIDEQLCGNGERGGDWWKSFVDGVDGGHPAKAAT